MAREPDADTRQNAETEGSDLAESGVSEDPPVLEAVRRVLACRPGVKSHLLVVKATVEAMMADGWTKRDEHAIRADERAKARPLNSLARELAMAVVEWRASDGDDDKYAAVDRLADRWRAAVVEGD